MKKTVLNTMIAAIAGLSMASAANAAVFGDGGTALQGVLDGITVAPTPGSSSTNVVTDEIDDTLDSTWAITGAGGSVATVIIELAGLAGTNEFGVYDSSAPGSQVTLFSGAATTGSQVVLSIAFDGSVNVNFADSGIDFAGNSFGYFLRDTVNGNTWFSDTALNSDGLDHMYSYQGTGTDTIQIPGLAAGTWTDNEFILAWEDLHANVSDKDYTDFVAIVESVEPIPEPSILALLGLGLLGFVGSRRK